MRHEGGLTRRGFIAGILGVMAAGCATPQPLPPVVADAPIRAITFSQVGNRAYRMIAANLARELPVALGSRYRPGAADGVTMNIAFRNLVLANEGYWGGYGPGLFIGGGYGFGVGFGYPATGAIDTLDTDITFLRGGRVVGNLRFFASTQTRIGGFGMPDIDPLRMQTIASAYAWWLARRLNG